MLLPANVLARREGTCRSGPIDSEADADGAIVCSSVELVYRLPPAVAPARPVRLSHGPPRPGWRHFVIVAR